MVSARSWHLPSRWDWLLLAGVAVLVAGSVARNREVPGHTWPAAVAAVAAGAAVLLAARAPRLAVPVAGVVAGAYFAGGLGNGPIFLAPPAAAAVAAAGTRPRHLLAPLGLCLVSFAAGLQYGSGDPGQAVGGIGLTAAGAALGWWYGGRREVRRQTALRTVADERLRMAHDLHDGVGHGLAVIAMQAGVALHLLDRAGQEGMDAAGLRRHLVAIHDTSKESLAALRAELTRLAEPDAPRAPAPGLDDVPALVRRVRDGGLDVQVHGLPAPATVPAELGHTVYAVVQEALTNVLRHAGPAEVQVLISPGPEELSVTIRDRGSAGQAPRPPSGPPGEAGIPGMGIPGMRLRVEALGGRLEAGPDGDGFAVRAVLPLPAAQELR